MIEKITFGAIVLFCFKAHWVSGASTTTFQLSSTTTAADNCCDSYNYQYCCPDDVADYDTDRVNYVGISIGVVVVGSIVFLIIIVSVIVAVCCCCRKTRGQTGQVYQSTYPAIVVYGGQNPYPGYSQVGCVNGSLSAQILQANVQPSTPQSWESPPSMNKRTSP